MQHHQLSARRGATFRLELVQVVLNTFLCTAVVERAFEEALLNLMHRACLALVVVVISDLEGTTVARRSLHHVARFSAAAFRTCRIGAVMLGTATAQFLV